MAVCLHLPAAALADQQAPVSQAVAQEALAEAAEAVDPSGNAAAGAAPADPTTALNALAGALPALDARARSRARALLARPTDGAADRYGDGYPDGAPIAFAESEHFCVHFVDSAAYADAPNLSDGDGDGRPDYVEALLEIAEYSYSVEVEPGPLGWLPPKPDRSGCGTDPSARADVYLKQLGNSGVYGYESTDPGQGARRSKYGYLVLDDDYARAEYGLPEPLDAAKVTLAHEFNHLLQQNYDSFQDSWLFESTAVWAEEQVYPAINDYVGYIPSFASHPGVPITDQEGVDGLKIYGAAVWNHWLTGTSGGYGVDGVRRAWEVSDRTDPADFAVGAYGRAIQDSGGRGFGREFAQFAAATAEWRTGVGGFPDAHLYPDVRRKERLRVGGAKEMRLDHTAYRMFDVRSGGDAPLILRVEAKPGLRSGFALVARDGDALTGRVTTKSRYLSEGGKERLTLAAPGEYERITAVAINADGRIDGFAGADWAYRRDHQRLSVALERY